MKRNRTTRRLLGLESLETRQLMAGLTTPIVSAPARLPAPTPVPAVIAKPTATSLVAPIVDTTGMQTSKLVGTPLVTQTQDLGTRELKSPGSTLVNNEPLAENPLDKLPSDPTSQLDEAESLVGGEDEAASLFDLDASFNQLARTMPDVFTTVAGSTTSPTPQPGSTRYGDAQSLFGQTETVAGGNATRPILVEYEEGTGITKVNDGMNDQSTGAFKTWLLDKIGWQSNPSTATSEALKQAEEEDDKNSGRESNSGSTSNASAGESNTESTTTTQDSSESNAESNAVVKQVSTEDGTTTYFWYEDGTFICVDLENQVIVTVLPDGTITKEDIEDSSESSSPSTPVDDTPPLDPWVQEAIDQLMAEMRAAQNYQTGSGDIDWGDFDTAGGYLVSHGAVIPEVVSPCGGRVRPETIDQGDFQQPDRGDVDPNPNDGN